VREEDEADGDSAHTVEGSDPQGTPFFATR
jgi:hypothetical protein